jgi:hypothetical protein
MPQMEVRDMDISILSGLAQEGLRRWSEWEYGDKFALDNIRTFSPAWAWIWFLLRHAEDRPEWFPHGKGATLALIEASLNVEAQEEAEQHQTVTSTRCFRRV